MSQVRKKIFFFLLNTAYPTAPLEFFFKYCWGSYHRVDRLLGFFSSRPNRDPPTPSPTGDCVPPPLVPGGHTRACGEGWGRVTIRTRGQCGTPGICTQLVLTFCFDLSLEVQHTVTLIYGGHLRCPLCCICTVAQRKVPQCVRPGIELGTFILAADRRAHRLATSHPNLDTPHLQDYILSEVFRIEPSCSEFAQTVAYQ